MRRCSMRMVSNIQEICPLGPVSVQGRVTKGSRALLLCSINSVHHHTVTLGKKNHVVKEPRLVYTAVQSAQSKEKGTRMPLNADAVDPPKCNMYTKT
jgi:hypothetical protein